MKRIFISFILLISLNLYSHGEGIVFFHGTFAEAKAEAAKQHKLIFMDCFTTWCGPCNRMARDVFPREDVGNFFNEHFICCKMDMEKGEGLDIAKTFGVRSYPTYLFLDADGSLEHRTLGSKPSENFIADGKTAVDPKRNLHGLTERFNNGDKDTSMLRQLASITSGLDNVLCEKALAVYWTIVPEYQIIDQKNWDVFSNYETDINSAAFHFVSGDKKQFADKYGEDAVNNALFGKAAAEIRIAADTKDYGLFGFATNFLKSCSDKQINVSAGTNSLRFYRKTDQWNEYVRFADDFLGKYGDNQEIYNSVAWEIVSNSKDEVVLNKALDYINKSMKLEKNYGNSDTWANVLYKLKRYKEAEAAAKESIELAKKEKLDFVSTQELLDKIEKDMASSSSK